MNESTAPRYSCVLAGTLAVVACSGADETRLAAERPSAQTPSAESEGDGDSVDAEAAKGPLYVINTRVFSPEATLSHLNLVPSLDAGTVVDTAQSLELGDRAYVYAPPGQGRFYVTSGEGPTVQEYRVGEGGGFEPGRVVSFAGKGLSTTVGAELVFVSGTKAYLISDETLDAVVWNPEEMSVGETIDLGVELRPDQNLGYAASVLRGGQLVFVSYAANEDWTQYYPGTTVTLVDTATDVVSSYQEDRCAVMDNWIQAPNGDLYFASNVRSAAVYRMTPELGVKPCMLRMPAGQARFDDFLADPSALVGERPSGNLITSGAWRVFFQAADEALVAANPPTDALELTYGDKYWRYFQTEIGEAGAAEPVATLAPAIGILYTHNVDGRSLVTYELEDREGATTLIDFSQDPPAPGLVSVGWIDNVVRVR